MPRPTGPTDPNLTKLVYDLRKTKKKSYVLLARHLEKSRRVKSGVNVSKLSSMAMPKHRYAVPGKVLSAGEISKAVTVYAWSYSKAAKDKIERAGGECFSLQQMVKDNQSIKIVM